MNREEAKALLPVITAFAEGKVIQNRTNANCPWHDIAPSEHVAFTLAPQNYRIKPEPRIIYRVELQKKDGNWITWFHYAHEDTAIAAMDSLKNDYKDCRLVKFVEQL